MEEHLKIKINNEPVGQSNKIPENLSNGLFSAADKIAFTDPSVDILVQRVTLPSFAFWKYDFVVHRQTKLYFEQTVEKTFLFINVGEDVKIKFSSLEPNIIQTDQYNIFHTPIFQMTVFPFPSKKRYELILIDIGEGKPENVMELLLQAEMMNRGI